MQDRIIIIDDFGFIKSNIRAIANIAKRDGLSIVPLSDPAFLYLNSLGLSCINYHNFEEKDTYSDVYSTAKKWGLNWYRSAGRDITAIDNFSLGNIIEWSSIYFFSYFLKLHLLLPQLIEKLRPRELVLITCEDIVEATDDREEERINVLWRHIDLLPSLIVKHIRDSGYSVKLKIIKLPYKATRKRKKILLKTMFKPSFVRLNKFFLFLFRILSGNKGREKVLFFEGFHHFSTIMKSKQLKNFEIIHLQKTIGPSILFKLYTNGIRVESFQGGRHNSVDKGLFDLAKIKEALANTFIYRGQDILPYIWPRIEYLFRELFPDTVYPDLLLSRDLMRRISPKCLVVENDSTYYERLLVTVAKEFGVRSFVVQHGATWLGGSYKDKEVSIHDFYPLHCDTCFVFGKTAKDWLLGLGAESDKVVITGGARFDNYYYDKKIQGSHARDKKTVLILLNDSWSIEVFSKSSLGLDIFYRHISQFIGLAKRNPEINFIVRPRYQDHCWNRMFIKEQPFPDNFVISNQQVLEEVLSYTDVVIGYMSTAILEALIVGIPVISLNIAGVINHFPLWEFGLSRQATTFEDLEAQLKKLLFDSDERGSFVEGIKRNAHLINYNHDGCATGRIASQIVSAIV